ncbi:MAG TPA: glycosyltransferase family 2 protein [Tepidisphaeraceae bacterium]|nr:glycosyltransferase family 2 protein [Tepidisphaeraceae bacterium]
MDPFSIQCAVLIVSHNGRDVLGDCLASVLASDESPYHLRVVVVDNASADGSAELVAREFPNVDLIRCRANLGFAGGNNVGWEHIRRAYPRVRYVGLLNQDTVVRSGWMATLARFMDARPIVGSAQAKVLLHPQTDLFNTAGNVSHFLAFGFTTACGEPDRGQYNCDRSLGLVSGAAMAVRADAISRAGLFDSDFFSYLEDADLSWKLRQLGYELAYVPQSVVFHKYQFKRDWRHYFLLERNRWLLLGTYYKTATLVLLLPAAVLMEFGQIYFAWRNGLLPQKFRAWSFFLNRRNQVRLARRRRAAQQRRLIGDRSFIAPFVATVESNELRGPVLRRLANPFFGAYWAAARSLICW